MHARLQVSVCINYDLFHSGWHPDWHSSVHTHRDYIKSSVSWARHYSSSQSPINSTPLKPQVMWLGSPRSEAQVHVCLPVCGALWWVLLQQCCDYFSSSSVASCALSALCMYSKFRHHPHPYATGFLSAKFRFFWGLHCWASLWRKIAYSITHPAYLMPWEPKCLR